MKPSASRQLNKIWYIHMKKYCAIIISHVLEDCLMLFKDIFKIYEQSTSEWDKFVALIFLLKKYFFCVGNKLKGSPKILNSYLWVVNWWFLNFPCILKLFYNNIHFFQYKEKVMKKQGTKRWVYRSYYSKLSHVLAAAVAAKSFQSCLTLCDPMNCSLPGSSIHGIFQARVLE